MGRTGRSPERARSGATAHILVVEAERRSATNCARDCGPTGFPWQVCASPRKAQVARARRQPHLLLLDVDGAGASAWSLAGTDSSERCFADPDHFRALRPGRHRGSARARRRRLRRQAPGDGRTARADSRRVAPAFAMPRWPGKHTVRVGDLEIDLARQRVLRGGGVVRLDAHGVRVSSRSSQRILTSCSPSACCSSASGVKSGRHASSHLLQVYIARLRKKIEADPSGPVYLVTERGAGIGWSVAGAAGARRWPPSPARELTNAQTR